MGGGRVEQARLLQELSANARGYRMEAPTEVRVAPLAEVLGHTGAPAVEPAIEPTPSDSWLDTWSRVSGRTADRTLVRQVLEAVGPPAAYALLDDGSGPVATGRAVSERGWAGLFAMATVPEARRRGAGLAIIAGLGRWAAAAGATQLYLQVEAENEAARALYRRVGFRTAYTYHYRYRVAQCIEGGETAP